jgi:hypothetical protein
MILELVPEKMVKIKSADASVYVYNMTEVEKITKEENPNVGPPPSKFAPQVRTHQQQDGTLGESSQGGSVPQAGTSQPQESPRRVAIYGAVFSSNPHEPVVVLNNCSHVRMGEAVLD